MTPFDRIRQKNRPSSAMAATTRSSTRRRAAMAALSAMRTPWRRLQLQCGAQKMAKRYFKAMEDLREETFVVTEENLEWVFDESNEENEGPSEPQCYLILPKEIATNKCHTVAARACDREMSNECAICMSEYDAGDVVIGSRNCSHAFHQDCILDWLSREDNHNCPSCRATFWNPNHGDKRKKPSELESASSSMNDGSISEIAVAELSPDDTLDTDARPTLQRVVLLVPGINGLASVIDHDAAESVA